MEQKIMNFFENIIKNENYKKEFENIENTKDLFGLFQKYNPEYVNTTEEEFYKSLDKIINFAEINNDKDLENVSGGSASKRFSYVILSSALLLPTAVIGDKNNTSATNITNKTLNEKVEAMQEKKSSRSKILEYICKYGVQAACALFGTAVVFKILRSIFSDSGKSESVPIEKKAQATSEIPRQNSKPPSGATPPTSIRNSAKAENVSKPEWVRAYDIGKIDPTYIKELHGRLPDKLNNISDKNEFSEKLITQWTGKYKKIYKPEVLNRIRVVKENLVAPERDWLVDCIVNAANSGMSGGSGVDEAVHNAAGNSLKQFETAHTLNCKNYVAVPTPAFNLESKEIKNIIHVAAPQGLKNKDNKNEIVNMWKCYANAIKCAKELSHTNVAIPALGVGIFGDYLAISTMIAYEAAAFMLAQEGYENMNVIFVCFNGNSDDARAQCAIYNLIDKQIRTRKTRECWF